MNQRSAAFSEHISAGAARDLFVNDQYSFAFDLPVSELFSDLCGDQRIAAPKRDCVFFTEIQSRLIARYSDNDILAHGSRFSESLDPVLAAPEEQDLTAGVGFNLLSEIFRFRDPAQVHILGAQNTDPVCRSLSAAGFFVLIPASGLSPSASVCRPRELGKQSHICVLGPFVIEFHSVAGDPETHKTCSLFGHPLQCLEICPDDCRHRRSYDRGKPRRLLSLRAL